MKTLNSKKLAKLTIGAITPIAAFSPIAAVIACGSTGGNDGSSDYKVPQTDLTIGQADLSALKAFLQDPATATKFPLLIAAELDKITPEKLNEYQLGSLDPSSNGYNVLKQAETAFTEFSFNNNTNPTAIKGVLD